MNELLLLIDGLNVLRRVYGANPAPDSPEKAAGAVKSATSTIKRVVRQFKPTHAMAVFDTPGKNWRHDLYARYREGRSPMPMVLRDALPFFLDNLDSLDVAHDAPEEFEADDGLNGYAYRWSLEKPDALCVVGSTDKDIAQLQVLGPNIRVRNFFTEEWHDEAWSMKKFGVPPALIADHLALTGDSVDGVPGVRDVGLKTAAKLLMEHGSLEAVLAAAATMKGKLGERLRDEADTARLSRQLVALRNEGEGLVKFGWNDLWMPENSPARAEPPAKKPWRPQ